MADKRKILILGGGFGGIKAALELADEPEFEVSLISDHDDFRYYPTLYHAATGGRVAASSIPLAEIFEAKPIKLQIDTAESIDRQAKTVRAKSGQPYSYDVLIVALGVVTNFFGIKGLKQYSYGIKTLSEAKELRDHLHRLIADQGKPDLNYVVIGAGPTGVELAGALPAYLKYIMRRHGIEGKQVHIDLVEAANRVTPRMPQKYSRAIQKRLHRLGIQLHLKNTVEAETADTLTVSGHDIKSHTVVWTAGVTNHPFFKQNDFELTEQGKVVTDQYLQAEPDIYVIGDNADTPYSGMAQTALYDAAFVTDNLKLTQAEMSPKTYLPKQPIYITPVGPRWAAVQWGKFQIFGWPGWVLRRLADFAGYHDYQPWWRAGKRWMASNQTEETCPICLK